MSRRLKHISQAVIIAGGKGERLGLKTKPKPMAVIGGQPVLGHIIHQCELAGIENILILASHMADDIASWCGDRSGTAEISVIRDDPPLGTAGALKKVTQELDQNIMVTYGDMIFDVDLVRMEEDHFSDERQMTLFCQPNDHPFHSDLVQLGEGRRIKRLYRSGNNEKIRSNIAASCIYMMQSDLLNGVPAKTHADLGRGILNENFCQDNKVVAYISSEWINDMGTPQRLRSSRRIHVFGKTTQRRATFPQPLFFHSFPSAGSDVEKEIISFAFSLKRTRMKQLNILYVNTSNPHFKKMAGASDIIELIDNILGEQGVFFDEIIVREPKGVSCRSMAVCSFDLEALIYILNADQEGAAFLREFVG